VTRWPSLIAAALGACLSGCAAVGGFTGAVAAIATGTATSNPGVGLAVGITVKAATDETLKRWSRHNQDRAQQAIAGVVADMSPGDSRTWEHPHVFGRGHDHGEVRVVRLIETPLARCKEILFSVDHAEGAEATRAWYTTTACQHGDLWRWAAAEPAVERWGALQ
jgi:hypothetical protein